MGKIVLSIVLTFLVISLVPFVPYAIFAAVFELQPPSEDGSPARFIAGVFVTKIGTAITFVLIFYAARSVLGGRWALYALLWWIMFIIHEIGQAIGPNYGWPEAVAGMIAETIYCPLSAYLTNWLIGRKS